MDILLVANNVTSLSLVILCWWLTHTYSLAGYPYGKLIAVLWGVLGTSVMTTMFVRNLNLDPSWLMVISKLVICALAFTTIRRVQKRYDQREEMRNIMRDSDIAPATVAAESLAHTRQSASPKV